MSERLRKADDAGTHPTAIAGDTILGGVTSDWLDTRMVTIEVSMPKAVRKALKREAKDRSTTIDALVLEALRERPRR